MTNLVPLTLANVPEAVLVAEVDVLVEAVVLSVVDVVALDVVDGSLLVVAAEVVAEHVSLNQGPRCDVANQSQVRIESTSHSADSTISQSDRAACRSIASRT